MGEVPSYVNNDGSQTELAKKMGDCFDVEGNLKACEAKRTELKEAVKSGLPDQTKLNLTTYTVSSKDGKGLFGVLQKIPDAKLNESKYIQLAYGHLSAQVNKKGTGNIDLLVPGDTIAVVNGVITVTRKAGSKEKNWSASLYPWEKPAVAPQSTPITAPTSTPEVKPLAPRVEPKQEVRDVSPELWNTWAKEVVKHFLGTQTEAYATYTGKVFYDNGKGVILYAESNVLNSDPTAANLRAYTPEDRVEAVNALNAAWKEMNKAPAPKPIEVKPAETKATPSTQKPQGKGPEAGEH